MIWVIWTAFGWGLRPRETHVMSLSGELKINAKSWIWCFLSIPDRDRAVTDPSWGEKTVEFHCRLKKEQGAVARALLQISYHSAGSTPERCFWMNPENPSSSPASTAESATPPW